MSKCVKIFKNIKLLPSIMQLLPSIMQLFYEHEIMQLFCMIARPSCNFPINHASCKSYLTVCLFSLTRVCLEGSYLPTYCAWRGAARLGSSSSRLAVPRANLLMKNKENIKKYKSFFRRKIPENLLISNA